MRYCNEVIFMYSIVTRKNTGEETTAALRETDYTFEALISSHDYQLRRQCIARIDSVLLNKMLMSCQSGYEAFEILTSLGLGIDNVDAGESPLTWIHTIYLSIKD